MESELQNNRECDVLPSKISLQGKSQSYGTVEDRRNWTSAADHRRIQMSILLRSLEQRIPINVRMFDVSEQLMVIGIIDEIDDQQERFLVDGEWFLLKDIADIF